MSKQTFPFAHIDSVGGRSSYPTTDQDEDTAADIARSDDGRHPLRLPRNSLLAMLLVGIEAPSRTDSSRSGTITFPRSTTDTTYHPQHPSTTSNTHDPQHRRLQLLEILNDAIQVVDEDDDRAASPSVRRHGPQNEGRQ